MTRLILMMLLAQSPARQAQTGVVSGQLLRTDGTPAAGVRIAVTPVSDSKDPNATGDLMSLASTDDAGNYRLEDILPGRYYIQAGLLDFPNYYPGTSALDKATIVTVAAGEVVHADVFKMVRPPGVRISGHLPADPLGRPQNVVLGPANMTRPLGQVIQNGNAVIVYRIDSGVTFSTNASGNPVPRILMGMPGMPGMPGSGSNNPTTVNADGTFEILGVKPGTYNVFVLPSAVQATVVVDDKDIEIRSTTEGGVKVSGFLGLHERAKGSNQKLTLTGPVWGRIDALTDPGGNFEFPTVTPGTYTVRSADGLALSTIVVADKDLNNIAVPTQMVINGEIIVEDMGAPNAVPPLLTATKSDGTVIPIAIPRGPMTVFADGTGTKTAFKLTLGEGEYRIAFNNVMPPFVVKSMMYGDVDLLKNPLVVDGSSTQEIRVTIGKNP